MSQANITKPLSKRAHVMQQAHKRFTRIKKQSPSLQGESLVKVWVNALKWAWKVCYHFTPLNVWVDGVQESIKKGWLKLSQGEAVFCGKGKGTKASYYVSHTKHTIHLVHWQGSVEATQSKLERALRVVNRGFNKAGSV